MRNPNLRTFHSLCEACLFHTTAAYNTGFLKYAKTEELRLTRRMGRRGRGVLPLTMFYFSVVARLFIATWFEKQDDL